MRLIDADDLKQEVATMTVRYNLDHKKCNAICELIDSQPTIQLQNKRMMTIKEYNNGLLKTELSEDGKRIYFSLRVSDLKMLFKNSTENYHGDNIKKGREREFVDFILNRLSEPSTFRDDTVKWLLPFEEIFLEILEGYEEFVTYKE